MSHISTGTRIETESGSTYLCVGFTSGGVPKFSRHGADPVPMFAVKRELLPNMGDVVRWTREERVYLAGYNRAGTRCLRVLPLRAFKGMVLASGHGHRSTAIVRVVQAPRPQPTRSAPTCEGGKFRELVEGYAGSMANQVVLTARHGEDLPFEQRVLLHKLEKHRGDNRKVAQYIALFLRDYPGPLSRQVAVVAKAHELKLSEARRLVGYPHRDGTCHWFQF